MSRFSLGDFLSRHQKKSWANPSVFEKVSSMEKNMDEKGLSRLSVGNFLTQIAERQRGRTLLCFRKVLLPKMFSVVGCHNFVDLFCLTVQKIFVGGTLSFGNVLVLKN